MGSPVGRVGQPSPGVGLLARSGSALGCAVAEQGTEGAEAVQDRAFSDSPLVGLCQIDAKPQCDLRFAW
jgi:hypothetical protein